jgi:hypothetical protein
MDKPLEDIPAKIVSAAQEGMRGRLKGVSADATRVPWSDEICPHSDEQEQSNEGATGGHHPIGLR